MSRNEFLELVEQRYSFTDERWGQAAFNVLAEHFPEQAEMIRGGPLDPFHNDKYVLDMLDFLGIV